jgi:hypothetical protein
MIEKYEAIFHLIRKSIKMEYYSIEIRYASIIILKHIFGRCVHTMGLDSKLLNFLRRKFKVGKLLRGKFGGNSG